MATRWRLQHSATVRESGQGLVEYALIVALVAVVVIAVLVLLGPALGNVFGEIKVGMQGTPSADEQELTPTPTPDHVVVSVLDAAGQGIANVRVYAFNPAGGYLGRTATTDENGDVAFELDDGRYKFRADYQRKQFWSPVIEWPREWHAIVETGQRPFAVTVADAAGGGIANVQVYAFTGSGSYISVGGRTDAGGQITFDLSDGDYKFRADYQGKQFWSAVASSPAVNAAVVETGRRLFVVTVADAAGSGITNVQVYAFTASGSYIGVGGRTDGSGQVSFDLSDGDYKFRADYQGKQFWSAEINSPTVNTTVVQTGQRPFVVSVVNAAGGGIANVQVYAFTSGGSYLGLGGRTDASGRVTFDLSDGDYRFRADYQGQQFWSSVVTSPAVGSVAIQTGQASFLVRVVDAAGHGIQNVQVYAFTSAGSYIGLGGRTGGDGRIEFDLSSGDYKFRADYQGKQFWSPAVNTGAGSVDVQTGQRPMTVWVTDAAGDGIPNLDAYAFTAAGGSVGVNGRTDGSGQARLDLSDGDYKFRVYHQAKYFWSAVVNSPAVSETTIPTGQRPFAVRVVTGAGAGVHNVNVYAFTAAGSYVGVSGRTDNGGQATLDLSDGDYKFRADYSGRQFWSDVVNSPGSSSASVVVE